jgi:hypothetical protein
MTDQPQTTKAERAAAARAARRAAQEAAALRANLHKRKAQARAASIPQPEPQGPETCR